MTFYHNDDIFIITQSVDYYIVLKNGKFYGNYDSMQEAVSDIECNDGQESSPEHSFYVT